jgi:hypothetical protein
VTSRLILGRSSGQWRSTLSRDTTSLRTVWWWLPLATILARSPVRTFWHGFSSSLVLIGWPRVYLGKQSRLALLVAVVVGLGLSQPGDLAISLGTSDTLFFGACPYAPCITIVDLS